MSKLALVLVVGLTLIYIAVGVAVFIAWGWVHDHVLPRNPWWANRPPYLPRRHLESFRAWGERHAEAQDRYIEAQHDILDSPDAANLRVSERGWTTRIPANHPLALRLLAAKYPDGPSYEELAKISVLVEPAPPGLQLVRGGKGRP